MSKRDKELRRIKRKARKAARSKPNKASRPDINANKTVPQYSRGDEMYIMDDIFPKEFDKEKRKKVMADICKDAKQAFDSKLSALGDWFDEFDSCYLLSFYAFYFMSQPEGSTSEIEGDFKHYQHYLEILQAVALSKERNIGITPLKEKAQKLETAMSEFGMSIQFKNMDVDSGDTDEVLRKKFLISQMRNDTSAIRNWAYYPQMLKVTASISSTIDVEFNEKYNLESGKLATSLVNIHKILEPGLQEHQEAMREFCSQKKLNAVFDTYERVFPGVVPTDHDKRQEMYNGFGKSLRNVKYALVTHSDLRLPDLYTFTAEEFAKHYGDESKLADLTAILDKLSFQFGQLSDFNLEHSVLGNPVLLKPFIKLEYGKYFCPTAGSIPHFTLQIIESLIADDEALKTKYENRKADYCEEFVYSTLEQSFPSASVFKKVKWRRSDKSDVFETDVIVLISNFALVTEVKSGKVTPEARRGAPDRLQKHIEQLIIDPSSQANNFIEAARKGLLEIISIDGKNGALDLAHTAHYLPLAVTSENLGISTNPRTIVDAGMNHGFAMGDFAVTMSMTDLESVCSMLDFETMKLHYIVRRRDLNAHIDFMADEMDLLDFYLTTGFNMGNDEYAKKIRLNLVMASFDIDTYFINNADHPVPKPPNYLIDEWKAMLSLMARRQPEGWIEASFALLSCAKDDQANYIKTMRKYITDFTAGRINDKNPYALFKNGADARQSVIATIPYKDISREDKLNLIAYILESDDVKNCKIKMALGVDVNRPLLPYDVMAITKDSQLVEEPLQVLEY